MDTSKTIIHKGKILHKVKGSSVIECVNCGFKHIIPLPSIEKLTKLYKQDFYTIDKPYYFKNNKTDHEWWTKTYNNYLLLLEKHTKGKKLLDIGSGPGDFLVCAKNRGWKILGIEPSKAAYKYSKNKNLPIINKFFTYDNLKQFGKFDVIHASMVLEHVPDPVSFISDAKKLLKQNGLIAIYCPNDYNSLQELLYKKLKYKPWWVVPKHHLNYFSASSMKDVLTKNGFKTLECLGTFPMEFYLLSGLNYIENDKIGRECQKLRMSFEMNLYKNSPEILNHLYSELMKSNVGRSFFIIARRK